jgi:preprotein translocase subunit YajC
MLKFIKGNMESIGGIEIFPIISLSIFFLFFVIMFFLVIKMRKQRVEELSQLPLED